MVPLRAEPTDRSEQVSQLLFGDVVSVLEMSDDEKWLRIQHVFDGYVGWIDLLQLAAISEEEYLRLQRHPAPVVANICHFLHNNRRRFPVTIGCSLPFYEHGKLYLAGEHYHFQGEIYDTQYPKSRGFVMQAARQLLHAPYQWGGRSPFGIDCSGFVQLVFKMAGYRLLRDAYQQAEQGRMLDGLSQAEPGDIAFFERNKRIVHVGILLEDRKIIHARGCVRIDLLDNTGILDIQTQTYSHRLSHISRIVST
ncbi:C40 family peptidase [Thermonema rossianum]|uniref:C40 family peptidase n=1 Tax=Thermonema rossianum TaxID=55505 RepID=UPI00056E09C2|nr:C40 family peptidase [Thermonema rossianum]